MDRAAARRVTVHLRLALRLAGADGGVAKAVSLVAFPKLPSGPVGGTIGGKLPGVPGGSGGTKGGGGPNGGVGANGGTDGDPSPAPPAASRWAAAPPAAGATGGGGATGGMAGGRQQQSGPVQPARTARAARRGPVAVHVPRPEQIFLHARGARFGGHVARRAAPARQAFAHAALVRADAAPRALRALGGGGSPHPHSSARGAPAASAAPAAPRGRRCPRRCTDSRHRRRPGRRRRRPAVRRAQRWSHEGRGRRSSVQFDGRHCSLSEGSTTLASVVQFVQVQLVQLASSRCGTPPRAVLQSTMSIAARRRGARAAAAPAPNARSNAAATAFGIAGGASTACRHFSCASSTASHPGHSSTREPL